jgi:phospholipase D1/2
MGKGSAEPEAAVLLLHGDLDISIVEAKCLPNMDIMSERMRRCFSSCGGGAGACGDRPAAPPNGPRRGGGRSVKKKIITSDPTCPSASPAPPSRRPA